MTYRDSKICLPSMTNIFLLVCLFSMGLKRWMANLARWIFARQDWEQYFAVFFRYGGTVKDFPQHAQTFLSCLICDNDRHLLEQNFLPFLTALNSFLQNLQIAIFIFPPFRLIATYVTIARKDVFVKPIFGGDHA